MKKCKMFFTWIIMVFFTIFNNQTNAQMMPEFKDFSTLPHTEGMAGMFAGQSKGQLFCMGGANFPGKKPWEGGKKIWYDEVYMFSEGKEWIKLETGLPSTLAYGVSVTYKDEIVLIGGNDDKAFHDGVFGLTWNGKGFNSRQYPALPVPLANMAGALVGSLVVVAGGTSAFTGAPLNTCYALDLDNPEMGWISLPTWPGAARIQPVGGSYNGSFYLFSGEMVGTDHLGKPERRMLQDAFRFTPEKKNGSWSGTWETLPLMPRSATAAANPVPVLPNGQFVFWGGVDAEKAMHKDPVTHPGIDNKVFFYEVPTKTWSFAGTEMNIQARVTLPSVLWNGYWLYISGEIKPGIRTSSIVGIKNGQ